MNNCEDIFKLTYAIFFKNDDSFCANAAYKTIYTFLPV